MRKAPKRDLELAQVLQWASSVCRKGLRSFYCRRVAGVPAIRQSSPLQRYCNTSKGTTETPPSPKSEILPISTRVVAFILAFGYPENIGRLIFRLAEWTHHILLHVDAKKPQYFTNVKRMIRKRRLRSVSVVSKLRVNRGGVSTLNAWLFGIAWLLEHAGQWEYFINLNDSDYPIARPGALQRFFWLNAGANFINVGSAFKDCDCGRYLVYECGDELYSIAPELQYPRRPELEHASGPNLVAISYSLAAYIVSTRDMAGTPVQQVYEDLSILQQPDEKFFQTVMVNSPFCRLHVRWSMHMWDRPGLKSDAASPEVAGPELKMLTPPLLSESFWPRLQEVKQRRLPIFFARKFDNNRTKPLQDSIDAALDGASSGFGIEASGFVDIALGRAKWLGGLVSSCCMNDLVILGTISAWHENVLADGVYLTAARFRIPVRMPCSGAGYLAATGVRLGVAVRECFYSGMLLFEELGARPVPPQDPAGGALPLVGAIRIGSGWSRERLEFSEAVSIVPVGHADDLTAVIYWTHVAVYDEVEGTQKEVEVRWHGPTGQILSSYGTVAMSSLVSWLQPPSPLSKVGEWMVEVRAGGVILGSRFFHICTANCAKLPSSTVWQYFHMKPHATS